MLLFARILNSFVFLQMEAKHEKEKALRNSRTFKNPSVLTDQKV